MNKFKAFILLTRPLNSLIAIFVVFVALRIAGCFTFSDFFIASLAVVLLSSFANSMNDLMDYKVDKAAHPKRPLPSGTLNSKEAAVFTIVLFILTLVVSFAINRNSRIIFFVILVLVISYNLYFKRIAFLGNLIVSIILGGAFIFAGSICDNVKAEIIPFFFALLYNLARELVKDAEDSGKEAEYGYRTLPVVLGINGTKAILTFYNAVILLYAVIVYLLAYRSTIYLAIITVVSIITLAASALSRNFTFLSLLYKILMIPVLIAIWIGGVR